MTAEFSGSLIGDSWRYLVSAVGALLFAVGVGSVLLDGRLTETELLQVSSLVVLSALLVAVGARIAIDITDTADAVRVLASMSVGVIAFAVFGGWFQMVVPTAETSFEMALLFLSVLSAGGLFGAIVGYYNVRVRGLVRRASREEARREFLDQQQSALSALNDILRHQILNDLSAIGGHAELLRSEQVEPTAAADTIESRCDHMAALVTRIETVFDVLTLVTTTDEVVTGDAIDRAIVTLQADRPDPTVTVEGPTDVAVRADDLLYLAVYELLDNAVVHGHQPVTVTVDTDPGTVSIAVSDAGTGITDARTESLFDPNTRGTDSDGDGLGLFLADLIVDRYDGDIQLAGVDPTVFEIRLDAYETDRRH